MTIYDIKSLDEAKEILLSKNLKWDRLHRDIYTDERDFYTGQPKLKEGIHLYFMQGNSDIGYYTERMNTLHIHDQPRPWHENLLKLTWYEDLMKV